MDFQHRTRTHQSRFSRLKRRSDEIRREHSLDRLDVLRRPQQACAPLCSRRKRALMFSSRKNMPRRLQRFSRSGAQACCNLLGMFFRDENIKARFRLEQSGFERQLGSIVRMQMELRDGWCLEIESIRGSEAETAQARGKQPRG